MSKHTPGPWYVGAMNDALFIIDKKPHASNDYIYDIPDVTVIAKVCALPEHAEDANARLMSAAPDLLEACEEMIQRGGSTRGEWCPITTYKKMVAAIKKASGE